LLRVVLIAAFILSNPALAQGLAKDSFVVKGIYHRARPAKKDPSLDIYAAMNDDDVFEQIEVYSAVDELSFINEMCDESCLNSKVSFVVTRQLIEDSGVRNLPDILKMVPGFDVSLGVSGDFKVSYRGLREDARTKLFIDGSEIHDSYKGKNFWSIPADLIEKVEVFYGPNTLENRAGVLNASVHVTSRKQEGINGHFYAGGVSNYAGSIALGVKAAQSKHYISTQIQVDKGASLPIEADGFSGKIKNRDVQDLFTHSARRSFALFLSSEIPFSGDFNSQLLVNAQVIGEQRGPYIGYLDVSGPNSELAWLTWNTLIRWQVPYAKNNLIELKLGAGQHVVSDFFQLTPKSYMGDEQADNPVVFDDGVNFYSRYQVLNLFGQVHNKIRIFEDNYLTINGDIEATGILSDSFHFTMNRPFEGNSLKQNDPCLLYGFRSGLYSACRMTLSMMLQDEWQIEKPLRLFAGLRIFSVSDIEFDLASHLNPQAGTIVLLGNNWVIKVLLQQGMRLPTLQELYDQTPKAFLNLAKGHFLGNEFLKPEIARSLEINLAYKDSYKGTNYHLEMLGYLAKVTQAIEKFEVNTESNHLKNNGDYFIAGFESNARALFSDGSYVFFNTGWFQSYWQATDDSGIAICDVGLLLAGNETTKCSFIRHLPQIRANLGGSLALGKLGNLFAILEMGSKRQNSMRSKLEKQRSYQIAPYAYLNLSFRTKPIFQYFILQASVFNLFNFKTEDDVSHPEKLPGLVPREGQVWYVGISATI